VDAKIAKNAGKEQQFLETGWEAEKARFTQEKEEGGSPLIVHCRGWKAGTTEMAVWGLG